VRLKRGATSRSDGRPCSRACGGARGRPSLERLSPCSNCGRLRRATLTGQARRLVKEQLMRWHKADDAGKETSSGVGREVEEVSRDRRRRARTKVTSKSPR
jgi:hypothetical protein